MMKLYSADLSPYAARVRMQIYAKGITDIAFEQPADWGMPKFRERVPIGRIPVLDIDGDLIPESEVIAEYLEEIYPDAFAAGNHSARERPYPHACPHGRHLHHKQHVHAVPSDRRSVAPDTHARPQ